MGKTIALDYGHGGTDSGACGNGYKEKDLTLKVGLQVANRLREHGFKVVETRTTDAYVGNASERGTALGTTQADYALSIHCNAGGGTGAELIVPNRESYGNIEYYLQEEFKKIGGWRKIFSRNYNNGTTYNRTINTSTLKFNQSYNYTDYYGVTRGAWVKGVSADIIELFFIDNASDVQNFISKEKEYVEAIVKAICQGFKVAYQAPATPTQPTVNNDGKTLYYRVVTGSYTSKEEALKQQALLNEKNISSFLVATYL